MATKNRERKDSKDLAEAANGKKNGFMTYDEVGEQMPQDAVSDQMDEMMSLGDEDIEIVDAATQVKIAPGRIAQEEAASKAALNSPAGVSGGEIHFRNVRTLELLAAVTSIEQTAPNLP